MYHTTQWPDFDKDIANWFWENEFDGSSFEVVWPEGVTSSNGMFTIEFYNAEDDSYIDRIALPVGN